MSEHDPPDSTPSIQGEHQAARGRAIWASDEAVDRWTADAPDGVLACRERGRHSYPPTRTVGMRFDDRDTDGFFVRRVPCDVCAHVNDDGTPGPPRVVRRETWDVRTRKGAIVRCDLVEAVTEYVDRGYLGTPGHGRMRPRQIRSATGSAALAGHDFRALVREVDTTRAERERAVREAYARSLVVAEATALRAVPDAG